MKGQQAPPPIVLVHGAWAGAWSWRRILAPLRAAGHEVHAISLSGCGERRHALRPDITLQTHIADITSLVQMEGLQGAVLVGHSYGGLVVTGAADTLLARDPHAVGQVVYVDAMLPWPGECWGSHHSEEVRTARGEAARASGLNVLPPPDPAGFGLSGADRDWLLRCQGPHPFNAYREPLHFSAQRLAAVPRAFIDCVAPAYPTIEPMRRRARSMPGIRVVEMATGHYPQVQDPRGFVAVLRSLVA